MKKNNKVKKSILKQKPNKVISNKQTYYKTLDNFKKALIKQLYNDLYKLNTNFYTKENITYENFLYEYYKVIDDNIDFDNPDYPGLVLKIDDYIKKNVVLKKQKMEKEKEIENLYQNSEWELIRKYKIELANDKRNQERIEKQKKMEQYSNDLAKQIEEKKKLNQMINDMNVEKENKYLLNEEVAKKELQEIKIEESQKNDDELIDDVNMDKDDMITIMVNKIMKQKKAEKIDSLLNGMKSNAYKENKIYSLPEIKYDQAKIDQILLKEMEKYQNI